MLIASWRDLSGEVVRLLQLHPNLIQRLTFAPRAAFHAYALYLRLIPAEVRKPAEELAAHLYMSDPRKLVREALPESDARLWQALGRLPIRIMTSEQYRILDRVMRSHVAGPALQFDYLNGEALTFLEELTRLDPLVCCAHRALSKSARLARVMHSALFVMRKMGVLEDEPALRRALQRLQADKIDIFLRRRFGRVVVPVPSMPADSKLRAVAQLNDLIATGRRFQNCIPHRMSMWWGLLDESLLYFEWSGDEPAIVSLQRNPADTYALSQMAGPENLSISPATEALIMSELERSGITVLPAPFGNVMDHMREALFGVATGPEFDFDNLEF